jgi:hypothetical protein
MKQTYERPGRRRSLRVVVPLVLSAVFIVSAGPSTASADTVDWASAYWTCPSGVEIPAGVQNACRVNMSGSLSMRSPSGMVVTCQVTAVAHIWNDELLPFGTEAQDDITSFTMSNCVTNLPGCAWDSVRTNGLPWTTDAHWDPDTAGFVDVLHGFSFSNHFVGAGCGPLNGVTLTFGPGDLVPDVNDPDCITGITFSQSSGTVPTSPSIGNVFFTGDLFVDGVKDANNQPVDCADIHEDLD